MIKNIEKNRLSGVINGPCDISYQAFVRGFIHDIELSNPFAVTLTMNSCSWRTHSQNFRHFMNRLNQSYLKNGYRRYGKRLTVIPTREGTRYVPFSSKLRELRTPLKDYKTVSPIRKLKRFPTQVMRSLLTDSLRNSKCRLMENC